MITAKTASIHVAATMALFGLQGCATPAPAAPHAALETEVRAFMAAYGDDLREHDREGIAARYHPDGTWFVLNGRHGFEAFAKIREGYLTKWRGPAAFAWRDLDFDVVGPDAVMVIGGFEWGAADGTRAYTYTGLLLRTAGGWRIRVEDETPVPVKPPPAPAS